MQIADYRIDNAEMMMPGRQPSPAEDVSSSPQKLVNATLSAWALHGASGVSARTLAAEAGLPVSSIYYHFGDLEQLFESAQREAQASARGWCDAQLEAIGRDIRGAAALGPLMATLIDDWCETQRTLAFAWRECQLMALRDARYVAICARWSALWGGFWQEACGRLGLADMAMATSWTFDGACGLHVMRWRRAVDRAALDELCRGWAAWLEGSLAPSDDWFALARHDAAMLIAPPPPDDAMVETIAAAAAATVARGGIAALTHRAVASEAGVTLGVVSYKFRTSADLLHAAFETIYRRLVPQSASEMAALPDIGRAEAIARLGGGQPMREYLLGFEELSVAAARDTAFSAFAAQLRYLRGRTSGRYLQALLGPDRPVAAIDMAIFSAFLSGRLRDYACGGRVAPDSPADEFAALLARLDRGR